MKFLLVLLAASACTFADAQQKNLWFVFLVSGDGPRPKEASELQRMQAAHIANFSKRHGEGKLIAAGPLADPGKKRRGIVVLTVPTRQDVMDAFIGDPFVENRIMTVDASPWGANAGDINTDLKGQTGMEEHRLVLLTSGRRPPDYLMRQHERFMKSNVHASIGGHLHLRDGFAEVLLFHGKDEAALRQTIMRDPLVHLGLVKLEMMPLYMGKGVLSERP